MFPFQQITIYLLPCPQVVVRFPADFFSSHITFSQAILIREHSLYLKNGLQSEKKTGSINATDPCEPMTYRPI